MDYFSIVLGQIIGFVIYILIGIIGVRMGVLTPRSLGVLSQFITKISLPLLLFTNTLNGATREQFIGDLPVVAATALMYIYYTRSADCWHAFSGLRAMKIMSIAPVLCSATSASWASPS